MINKVAIQGELGSFHHAAANRWYGTDVKVIACASFAKVFEALDGGLANSAVVAIENSLFGSINEVYDLLLAHKYPIVGEIPERIHQCLIGYKGADIKSISHVYSHPVALAQCSVYLDHNLPATQRIEHYDTAASVEYIKRQDNKRYAAIASREAAQMHNMTVLQDNIQNNQTNFTRFLVLQKQPNVGATDKASLVVQTNHQPGALYTVLGVFNSLGLNLSKLQSRPIPGKLWRYMFYIDIEATPAELMSATAQIKGLGNTVTVLGSYQKATETTDI